MLELEKIKNSPFFETFSLKKWEVLVEEWAIDKNIYIIYDWQIVVKKSISSHNGEEKILALLGIWNILWEWSLSSSKPKEVSLIAEKDTILLKIEAKKQFETFLKEDSPLALSILKNIINISNNRLLRSNRQITANHEVNIAINNISSLSLKPVLWLIDTFANIIDCDGLIFLEKKTIIENYVEYKYDSRFPGKLQDTIIDWFSNDVNFLEEKQELNLSKHNLIKELSIGKEVYGFLLITRNIREFNENEEKMLMGIANSFVWIIRQKNLLEEEKNKNYMKNS